MDFKNDHFDKDRLEDMVGEIIIEHDEDEDADRHLIDDNNAFVDQTSMVKSCSQAELTLCHS